MPTINPLIRITLGLVGVTLILVLAGIAQPDIHGFGDQPRLIAQQRRLEVTHQPDILDIRAGQAGHVLQSVIQHRAAQVFELFDILGRFQVDGAHQAGQVIGQVALQRGLPRPR